MTRNLVVCNAAKGCTSEKCPHIKEHYAFVIAYIGNRYNCDTESRCILTGNKCQCKEIEDDKHQ